jgi:hypothetical protein
VLGKEIKQQYGHSSNLLSCSCTGYTGGTADNSPPACNGRRGAKVTHEARQNMALCPGRGHFHFMLKCCTCACMVHGHGYAAQLAVCVYGVCCLPVLYCHLLIGVSIAVSIEQSGTAVTAHLHAMAEERCKSDTQSYYEGKLEQGKMILTPDDTQWRQHRRNPSEGDSIRQEDSTHSIYTLQKMHAAIHGLASYAHAHTHLQHLSTK